MKTRLFIYLICVSLNLLANDGAYFGSGNQLVPINDNDVSVKKEILTIKKIKFDFVEVSVYYEFFNSNEDKEIIVGFEALAPKGDVNGAPKNNRHPYMRDFTVDVNNEILPFEVAYVKDSLYAKSGTVKSINLETFDGDTYGNCIEFFYVYHFKATFKKGLNIVKHTYSYDLSKGIGYNYNFEYVLTAANRWANKQIDDFTLILDMGNFETFYVDKSFFSVNSDWLINGIGNVSDYTFEGKNYSKFNIQKGNLTFSKRNFHPSDELFVESFRGFREKAPMPFSIYHDFYLPETIDEFTKKTLKNLPFARRGYVFKDKNLKEYFETCDWYIPNPNYIPDVHYLTEEEKLWIEKFN